MQADISGPQRKILEARVTRVRSAHGSEGIPLRDGKTLPFNVWRSWSAPAGVYVERFYLIDPGTREVLFEGPEREAQMLGLQARTELVDEIQQPFDLSGGSYALVFSLGGLMGGEVPVEASVVGASDRVA